VALLVLASRAALTHIINHFLLDSGRLGGVWVGHLLEDLSATRGTPREIRQVTDFWSLVSSFNFPTFWREGRLSDVCNTLLLGTAMEIQNITCRQQVIFHQIYLRIELLINEDYPHTAK